MRKKSNQIEFRVRYGETDQMGIVHHANYARYFEMGRIEWLRSLGSSYASLEASGVLLPVLSLSVSFNKAVMFDDKLVLETTLIKEPNYYLEFAYKLFNQDQICCAEGHTKLVFLNADSRKPIRCPKDLFSRMMNF